MPEAVHNGTMQEALPELAHTADNVPVALSEQHVCMRVPMTGESLDACPCTTVFGSSWIDFVPTDVEWFISSNINPRQQTTTSLSQRGCCSHGVFSKIAATRG